MAGSMTPRLPPLAALRAFEAACRHTTFAAAAKELRLTPSAVSHQVRVLEEELGAVLFRRSPRGVVTTEAGERLANAVRRATRELVAGVEAVRETRAGSALRMSAAPVVASLLIAPALAGFEARHPDIQLSLEASSRLADLVDGRTDYAVRFGPGRWPDAVAFRLVRSRIAPVAAPGLADGGGVDLTRAPLIDLATDADGWNLWFERHDAGGTPTGRRLRAESLAVALQQAQAGQGVVLAPFPIANALVRSGALLRVGTETIAPSGDYYLLCSAARRRARETRLLTAWLRDLFAALN